MAKRKDSAALFEVVTRQHDDQAAMVTPQAQPAPRFRPLKQPPGFEKPAAEAKAPAQPAGPAEPMVAVSEGRLRLSLSYTTGAVAALVLVGLLLTAFALGRAAGRPDAQDQPPATASEGDTSDGSVPAGMSGRPVIGGSSLPGRTVGQAMGAWQVPGGGQAAGGQPGPAFDADAVQQQALARMVNGRRYLVVEAFRLTDANAIEIQKYLWENGILTVRCRLNDGAIAVLDASQDLTDATVEQQWARARQFEELGRRWSGAWKFRQTTAQPFVREWKLSE